MNMKRNTRRFRHPVVSVPKRMPRFEPALNERFGKKLKAAFRDIPRLERDPRLSRVWEHLISSGYADEEVGAVASITGITIEVALQAWGTPNRSKLISIIAQVSSVTEDDEQRFMQWMRWGLSTFRRAHLACELPFYDVPQTLTSNRETLATLPHVVHLIFGVTKLSIVIERKKADDLIYAYLGNIVMSLRPEI